MIATSNLCLLTDSYKPTHWVQYPPGTRAVHSFLESRGGSSREVMFFGLQPTLMQLQRGVSTVDVIEAKELLDAHFGKELFNASGWAGLVGRPLPLRIMAVPEGTMVPTGQVMMTVENTDPDYFWLTNYVESLLVQVWYPCSVATRSREIKATILEALTGSGTPDSIDFRLHDFGFRGSTSSESAAIGGLAHLVNFKGTDTLPALMLARAAYAEPMAGFSVPAAEHSTITSWGREHEADAYRNMLTQYRTGLVAVVSDSYDVYRACRDLWGGELRDAVLERDGIVVVRPDSGHPPEVVCNILRILGDAFGIYVNDKGYKVLHPKVRVIQGDGIDHAMVRLVLDRMEDDGWSADNITFGSGGGLLQKDLTRDTHRFAFKASAIDIDGAWRPVHKEPITDMSKRSKPGRLALVKTDHGFETVLADALDGRDNLLRVVFDNGVMPNVQTLRDVRRRASIDGR